MRAAITILLLAFSITVSAQSEVGLEINSKLSKKYAKQPKGRTLTAASNIFPFVELTIKNVTYQIAFDGDNRKIKYVFTRDEDFVDSNGLKVNQEITVKWEDIEVLGYFQLRTKPDKNGWQAVIGNSSAFDGDLLERIQKAGQFTTEIDGFAKGYNY
jgi:hypothetical protein